MTTTQQRSKQQTTLRNTTTNSSKNKVDLNTMATVLTSFKVPDYEKYAHRFFESWVKYWPKGVKLVAYYDGGKLPNNVVKASNITYVNLDKNKDLLDFKSKNAQFNGGEPYNYRMDVLKFSNKVFAICDYARTIKSTHKSNNWLVWIDADVITTKKISHDYLNLLFPDTSDIVHLGREGVIDYSETGFIGFNLMYNKARDFLRDWRNMYTTNEILGLREWTDAFSFERLLNIHKSHGLTAYNLSPHSTTLEAFDYSPLTEYFIHFKGGRKSVVNPVYEPGPARYRDIETFIEHYSRTKLLEVGTWDGKRALRLIAASLKNSDSVHYVGLDLFEDGSEELDKIEANVKRRTYLHNVKALLNTFSKDALKEGKKVSFELIKGNSKETLPKILERYTPDFAYIDGGHSVDTIRSDYNNLRNVPVVLFDDYYGLDGDGNTLNTSLYGCNQIVDSELPAQCHKGVIPSRDLVSGGGVACLAYVCDPSLPAPPDFQNIQVPIKVQPRDCVSDDYIHANIKSNHISIKKWIDRSYFWNREEVVCVSGGPSLKNDLEKIHELYEKGHKVICVKHSHNYLLENGIVPWGCIILDPRPITGVSTHGFKRIDLLAEPHPWTYYFVASMTDPSVFKYLTENKANIIGWDAYSNAVTSLKGIEDRMMITGGTCAAMRMIALMHTLGFRTFHLFGYDASMDVDNLPDMTEKDDKGRDKYLEVTVDGQKFITTGEMLAMGQDMEQFFQREDDIKYHVHGEGGMGHALWMIEKHKRNQDSYKSFLEVAQ